MSRPRIILKNTRRGKPKEAKPDDVKPDDVKPEEAKPATEAAGVMDTIMGNPDMNFEEWEAFIDYSGHHYDLEGQYVPQDENGYGMIQMPGEIAQSEPQNHQIPTGPEQQQLQDQGITPQTVVQSELTILGDVIMQQERIVNERGETIKELNEMLKEKDDMITALQKERDQLQANQGEQQQAAECEHLRSEIERYGDIYVKECTQNFHLREQNIEFRGKIQEMQKALDTYKETYGANIAQGFGAPVQATDTMMLVDGPDTSAIPAAALVGNEHSAMVLGENQIVHGQVPNEQQQQQLTGVDFSDALTAVKQYMVGVVRVSDDDVCKIWNNLEKNIDILARHHLRAALDAKSEPMPTILAALKPLLPDERVFALLLRDNETRCQLVQAYLWMQVCTFVNLQGNVLWGDKLGAGYRDACHRVLKKFVPRQPSKAAALQTYSVWRAMGANMLRESALADNKGFYGSLPDSPYFCNLVNKQLTLLKPLMVDAGDFSKNLSTAQNVRSGLEHMFHMCAMLDDIRMRSLSHWAMTWPPPVAESISAEQAAFYGYGVGMTYRLRFAALPRLVRRGTAQGSDFDNEVELVAPVTVWCCIDPANLG